MYYNRIIGVLVLDPVDYFLLSAFIFSLIGSYSKHYLSEKQAMERLRKSLIEKSEKLARFKKRKLKKSKSITVRKINLDFKGGDMNDDVPSSEDFENALEKRKAVMMHNQAENFRRGIEILAGILKSRELKGVLKFGFKGGRILLELILSQCNVNLVYLYLIDANSSGRYIAAATLTGSAASFTAGWLNAGATLYFSWDYSGTNNDIGNLDWTKL